MTSIIRLLLQLIVLLQKRDDTEQQILAELQAQTVLLQQIAKELEPPIPNHLELRLGTPIPQ